MDDNTDSVAGTSFCYDDISVCNLNIMSPPKILWQHFVSRLIPAIPCNSSCL